MNNSSCFSNKRKRKGEEEESTQVTQPSKRSRMVSLVKKVGQGLRDKIAVAVKVEPTHKIPRCEVVFVYYPGWTAANSEIFNDTIGTIKCEEVIT